MEWGKRNEVMVFHLFLFAYTEVGGEDVLKELAKMRFGIDFEFISSISFLA